MRNIGVYGNWYFYDQSHRACAVYQCDVLDKLFGHWGDPWEARQTRAITAEALRETHGTARKKER